MLLGSREVDSSSFSEPVSLSSDESSASSSEEECGWEPFAVPRLPFALLTPSTA